MSDAGETIAAAAEDTTTSSTDNISPPKETVETIKTTSEKYTTATFVDDLRAFRFRDFMNHFTTLALVIAVCLVGWRSFTLFTECSQSIVVVLSGSMEPGYHRGDIVFLHRRIHEPLLDRLVGCGEGDDSSDGADGAEGSAAGHGDSGCDVGGDAVSRFFLRMRNSFLQSPVEVGDIVVYSLPHRAIPIVHRVHRKQVVYRDVVDAAGNRRRVGRVLYLTKGDNNRYDDRMLYPAPAEWVERDWIVGKAVGTVPWIGYVTLIFSENVVVKYVAVALLFLVLLFSDSD